VLFSLMQNDKLTYFWALLLASVSFCSGWFVCPFLPLGLVYELTGRPMTRSRIVNTTRYFQRKGGVIQITDRERSGNGELGLSFFKPPDRKFLQPKEVLE